MEGGEIMIITVWVEFSAFSIKRDANFNVEQWFIDNKHNFKLLGITRIEYQMD